MTVEELAASIKAHVEEVDEWGDGFVDYKVIARHVLTLLDAERERAGSAKMLGSDFESVTNDRPRYCSECDKRVLKGERILVSRRNGKAMKYVCSENCRLEFDARIWDEIAGII
jgi:hypothetical protein